MELNSIKLDLMWFLKYVLLQNKEDGMSGWLVTECSVYPQLNMTGWSDDYQIDKHMADL